MVASGLLGSRQVALGMWGSCVARSIELSRLAGPGEVLADASAVVELDDFWNARPETDDHPWGVPDDDAFVLEVARVVSGEAP